MSSIQLLKNTFTASCREGEVRLVVSDDADTFYMGSTNYDSTYYDKNGLRVGRVEICAGGRFGTICIDSWDNMDASVTCSQLGFSRYGNKCISTESLSSIRGVHICFQVP